MVYDPWVHGYIPLRVRVRDSVPVPARVPVPLPSRTLRMLSAHLYTLVTVSGNPRSADSKQKLITMRSSAGVSRCFEVLNALMEMPPFTRHCSVLFDTSCLSSTAR